MKIINLSPEPNDAEIRRSIKPVISYPIDNLPVFDATFYKTASKKMNLIESIIIPPRDAKTFERKPKYKNTKYKNQTNSKDYRTKK